MIYGPVMITRARRSAESVYIYVYMYIRMCIGACVRIIISRLCIYDYYYYMYSDGGVWYTYIHI